MVKSYNSTQYSTLNEWTRATAINMNTAKKSNLEGTKNVGDTHR